MNLFYFCTAATRDQHGAPASFSGDESPTGSLARESDGDASPNNIEGTLKSWATGHKGTRSSRYGSVSGVSGANGARSQKSLPRTKELADALLAAARTEREDEVRQNSRGLCLIATFNCAFVCVWAKFKHDCMTDQMSLMFEVQ